MRSLLLFFERAGGSEKGRVGLDRAMGWDGLEWVQGDLKLEVVGGGAMCKRWYV